MAKKKNGWTLYHGQYEIKWKNGIADEICIAGVIMKIKPWARQARPLFASGSHKYIKPIPQTQ